MCRNTNLLFLWRRTLLNKIFIILISILSLNLLFTRDFIDPTPPNRDDHCDEGLFMDCNQNCYPEVFLVLLNNENCFGVSPLYLNEVPAARIIPVFIIFYNLIELIVDLNMNFYRAYVIESMDFAPRRLKNSIKNEKEMNINAKF